MSRSLLLLAMLPAALAAQGNAPNDSVLTGVRARPTVSAPAVPRRPRTQGSMVGYVDNAVIGSQLRMRFDIGSHDSVPDRAEFFYGKCGCFRNPAAGVAYDSLAAGPGPGQATDINFQIAVINGEIALNDRVSIFGEVPMRWLKPQAFAGNAGAFPDQSGIGDIRAGMKLGLVANEVSALTFQMRVGIGTGDALKGLGTGHASIEPALLYHVASSPRVSFGAQLAFWHPINGSAGVKANAADTPHSFAGDVVTWGFGPSIDLVQSRNARLAGVVELVGWRVLNGFQAAAKLDASGTNIVNLKLGARASFGDHDSFYLGYGRALSEAKWYVSILRAEYRRSF